MVTDPYVGDAKPFCIFSPPTLYCILDHNTSHCVLFHQLTRADETGYYPGALRIARL
jgi:hypothetical protein